MAIIIIFIILNVNSVYAKYMEIISLSYQTKIAEPIFIIDKDDKKIIEELNEENIFYYNFIIKNYDEIQINQIEFYYQFQINEIENIKYELKNLTTNKIIEFENNISSKIKLGLEKEANEYCFCIYLKKDDVDKNMSINLNIITDMKI